MIVIFSCNCFFFYVVCYCFLIYIDCMVMVVLVVFVVMLFFVSYVLSVFVVGLWVWLGLVVFEVCFYFFYGVGRCNFVFIVKGWWSGGVLSVLRVRWLLLVFLGCLIYLVVVFMFFVLVKVFDSGDLGLFMFSKFVMIL